MANLWLTPDHQLPMAADCPFVSAHQLVVQPLPDLNGEPCVAIEVDADATCEQLVAVDLREAYFLLPRADYRLAGKARELLPWNLHTRFCGACGGATEQFADIAKRCPDCGREYWPNIASAVIILIERPAGDGCSDHDEILLVQANNFKRDYYGLVAGFVETGESLEEAAVREIAEETGLKVRNLRYVASQPWPFPSVLMVGFRAEYDSGTLTLQQSELKRGGWFRRDQLPEIPRKVSLARHLIDLWLDEKEKTGSEV